MGLCSNWLLFFYSCSDITAVGAFFPNVSNVAEGLITIGLKAGLVSYKSPIGLRTGPGINPLSKYIHDPRVIFLIVSLKEIFCISENLGKIVESTLICCFLCDPLCVC